MFDKLTKRRLGHALSAQIYSQIVTIASQLALVPILLWSWGANEYGLWLVLSAVPTFLTFSDFGFTFVAKNEMVMAVSAGRRDSALKTFQSISVLLSIALPLIIIVSCVVIFATPLTEHLAGSNASSSKASVTLLCLIINVALYQLLLLVCAGIRSENRPSQETFVAATSRLVESISIAATAALGGSIAVVAFVTVLARIASLLSAYIWMRRSTPWLYAGATKATWDEIRRLAHPALAYMLIPISQAALIQGPVLILGMISTPLSVVVFSTSRTLARVGTSFVNVVNNTFVTEYASVAGRLDMSSYRRIQRLHLLIVSALSITYGLSLTLLAPFVMKWFTHGAVNVLQPFFLILVFAVIAEMIWSAQFTPLVAINRHRVVTYTLAGLSILGAPICYWAVQHAGISGAAGIILAIHATMIVVCAAILRKPLKGTAYAPT